MIYVSLVEYLHLSFNLLQYHSPSLMKSFSHKWDTSKIIRCNICLSVCLSLYLAPSLSPLSRIYPVSPVSLFCLSSFLSSISIFLYATKYHRFPFANFIVLVV